METNPYAPPKASLEGALQTDASAAPSLWNPNAAANWSLVLTPVFGAVLHMKNWQALGEPKRAAESKRWAQLSAGCFVLFTIVDVVLPETTFLGLGPRGAALGLLVAWYLIGARPQAHYVAERLGTRYRRKGWGKPLLFAALCLLGFITAGVMMIGTLVGMAMT